MTNTARVQAICNTCRFFYGQQFDSRGACRRRAPVAMESDRQIFSDGLLRPHWPEVAYNHWCGEHELDPARVQPDA